MAREEFHWRDGWYFSRMSDDAVRIRKMASFGTAVSDKVKEFDVTIPANEWASIVAHVAAGDDAVAFSAAQRLHSSPEDTDPQFRAWQARVRFALSEWGKLPVDTRPEWPVWYGERLAELGGAAPDTEKGR